MQKRYDQINYDAIKILKTLIINGGAVTLGFVITLLIIPFVTDSLGTEAYGFVSLANNFVSYITVLTIALNSYSVRYVSLYFHKGDYISAQQYYSSVIIANAALSFVVVLWGVIFSSIANKILVIPDTLLADVKFLFFLSFFNFGIQLLGNALSTFAYIYDRVDLIGISKFVAYIIEIIVFIFLFKFLLSKVWYVSIAYISNSLVILITNLKIAIKYSVNIKVSFKYFSLRAVYQLILNGFWNSVNSLGNILNTGLDLWITNRMLNSLVTGQLAIAKTMGSIIPVIYQLVSQTFQPSLLKQYAEGDIISLVKTFNKAMKLSGFCIGTFFCIFVSVGDIFFKLWLQGQNNDYIYFLTILTLMGYLMEGVVGPLYYIYTLCVKNKIPCLITILGGIVNVISMVVLLRYTSLDGYAVCGTTAVIMTFINLVTNPLYMTHCLKISWNAFYPIIIKYLLFIGITSYILRKLSSYICITSWLKLFLFIGVEIIIAFIIYFIIMYEKSLKRNVKNNNYSF